MDDQPSDDKRFAAAEPAGPGATTEALRREIAELRKNEKSLRESKERYRSLAELSPDAILIFLQGEIVFANHAATALFKADSHKELLGKTLTDLNHPEDIEAARSRLNQILLDKKSVPVVERRILRLDGSVRAAEISSAYIHWKGEGAVQTVLRDISGRKLVEEALAESEERYRTLVEMSPEAILIFSADGEIEFANTAAATLFGAGDPRELLGVNQIDLAHPDYRDKANQRRKEGMVRGAILKSAELKFLKVDGSEFDGEGALAFIYWRGGEAIQGVVHDITERKRAEAALRVSEARFRDFTEVSSDFVWELGPDLKYTFYSDRTESPPGMAAKNRDDGKLGDFADTEGDPERQAAFRNLLDRHLPFSDFEYVIRNSDGPVRNRSTSGKPIFAEDGSFLGYRGTTTDITERKKNEKALEDSERQFRAVTDAAPGAILYVDRNERYRFVNKTYADWLQVEADAVIGRTVREVVGPDVYAVIRDSIQRALAGESGTMELSREWPGAGTRYMSMSFVPDMGLDGDMAGYYALLTDITDLNEAREQLAQSQKLEAMGQLTGGVAHDFNNVLMAVLANLEMLEEDLGEGTEQVDMARAAKRAVRRGAEVTNQLLAFARKQTLAPTAIDLHELSLSLGTLLTPSMGETVDLSTRISEPLSPAFADRGLLQNALLNLAVNARDAMPDGGTLLIELGDVTLDATRLTDSDVAAPGDFVMIAVSDSGTGIEAHLLERIFDPFFTTKGMAKNSGLGMSMVQGFVQQSEGHLEIESEVGVGTTVRLFLPQAGTGTGAAAEAVSHQQAVPTGNETVLLVEDDVAVRETLASSLKRMGYTVVVVEDGPAALAVLAKQPVDAVVTDQIMPKGMTGTEMARQARKIRPDLDFVVITGYADALNSAAAGLKGNDQLLSKPFTTGTLAQALRNVLD